MRKTEEQQDLVLDVMQAIIDPPDLDYERSLTAEQRNARDDVRTWARLMDYDVSEIKSMLEPVIEGLAKIPTDGSLTLLDVAKMHPESKICRSIMKRAEDISRSQIEASEKRKSPV